MARSPRLLEVPGQATFLGKVPDGYYAGWPQGAHIEGAGMLKEVLLYVNSLFAIALRKERFP